MHIGEDNGKIQNKQIVIYNHKNELNKNRFYLRTKILIKIKIRDKKEKIHKKFSWQAIFRGAIFPGG